MRIPNPSDYDYAVQRGRGAEWILYRCGSHVAITANGEVVTVCDGMSQAISVMNTLADHLPPQIQNYISLAASKLPDDYFPAVFQRRESP